jgi:hypothetical protein
VFWIGYWIYRPLIHTTRNYSTTADLHNLQITVRHAKSSSAFSFLTRRFLVTAFNNGYSSDLGLKSSVNGGSLPTKLFFSLESESYVTTDGQLASLSWNKASICGLRPHFYYCHTVAGLLMWGALSDERTGLSFTTTAGPCERTHSRVRVQWDLRLYFTASSHSRLPFFRRLLRLAGLRRSRNILNRYLHHILT